MSGLHLNNGIQKKREHDFHTTPITLAILLIANYANRHFSAKQT